ncbi:MAG: hypothetical protein L0H55_16395 [Candidatus Nitrosocosmicus sp.]|nr:hypothetical protein [Candidatus Nitrosocosmicus sp.]
MGVFNSKSNNKIFVISPLVIFFVMTIGISSLTEIAHEESFSLMVFAQGFPNLVTNSSNGSIVDSDSSSNNSTIEQSESKIVKASGHFANNQLKDGIVAWIQGGLWNLEIDNSTKRNIENPNMNANFSANFTMIRPDGSLNHNHIINNLTSDNVIFAGNDIVVTGVSDIYADNGTGYEQVPITIHLMGKKVLGLMIDVNKTGGHFSGSNEMYGTLISGFGLESSDTGGNLNSNNLINREALLGKDNTSQSDPLIHATH